MFSFVKLNQPEAHLRSVKGKNMTGKHKWNSFNKSMEKYVCLKKVEVATKMCYFSPRESCFLPYLALFSFFLPYCLNSLFPAVPSSSRRKIMTSCNILLPHTACMFYSFLSWLARLQVLSRDYRRSFMLREPTNPIRPTHSRCRFQLAMWIFSRAFSTCWKRSKIALVDTNIKSYYTIVSNVILTLW